MERAISATNSWSFTTTCIPIRRPETPPSLASIGPQSVMASNSLQFAVSATPTEGGVVTLLCRRSAGRRSVLFHQWRRTFTWSPARVRGSITSVFYAADNDGATSVTVVITVQPYIHLTQMATD